MQMNPPSTECVRGFGYEMMAYFGEMDSRLSADTVNCVIG